MPTNLIVGTVALADSAQHPTITLDGQNANLTLGGGGHDGDLLMVNNAGVTTVGINGQLAAVHLGGTGQDGDLLLRSSSNQNTIRLDGSTAAGIYGGGSVAGRVQVTDASGVATILLDGATAEVRIRDWRLSVPDFVFEPGYRLPPPDELRAYIDEHRHLPDVPSAAQIAADGVDLPRLCMALLQKIEELTLYQLGQDERLRTLESRLAALESRS
jgi:hypothetical protein